MSFFNLLLIAASVFAFSVFENASAAETCREVQASFNEKTSADVSACVGQLFLRDVDATRIESATRSKNTDLLFSDDFLQQLRKEGSNSSYTDLGTVSLKGKDAPVRLWSLNELCVSPSQ